MRYTSIKMLLLWAVGAGTVCAQLPEPNGGSIRPGTFPVVWATGGPKCMEAAEWQVHEYNPDLYIMRQSGCTDFEKPFIFLLFGADRALLLDTGSRHGHLAPTLQLTVHRWLQRNHRESIPLIVAHTHSHSDHVAGDADLQALTDAQLPITFVAATLDATRRLYGIVHWPDDLGTLDLGGRVLDVVAIPGHDTVSVAVYDRQTAIVFTGDSVYPGRLYIRDLPAFEKSNRRLVRFTQGKVVAHLVGNHIEQQRTPYLDYPVGTQYQPDEHELPLSRGVLLEIQAGLDSLHGKPRRLAFRDFSLWPAGADFPPSAAEKAAFDLLQLRQSEHMWDADAP